MLAVRRVIRQVLVIEIEDKFFSLVSRKRQSPNIGRHEGTLNPKS